MSKLRLALAGALVLGLCGAAQRAAPPPAGEASKASLDVLLDAIRSNRKALVAVNLSLTDAEAARFWPVYERYQKEIDALGDRQVALIQDYTASYRDLSDEKATKLVADYLAVEADRVAARRAYLPEFAKILPGRKVARFYQIENKVDAVIRYDLAAAIPGIEEEKGGPATTP